MRQIFEGGRDKKNKKISGILFEVLGEIKLRIAQEEYSHLKKENGLTEY